jgi:hypothetical protein
VEFTLPGNLVDAACSRTLSGLMLHGTRSESFFYYQSSTTIIREGDALSRADKDMHICTKYKN